MTVKVALTNPLSPRSLRAGSCGSIAALLIFLGCNGLQNAAADGETRTISFHHIHTNEDLTVTYKVNGRYDEEALKKINHVLRDWRESEPIKMDPHLIDLLWEVHRETGAKEPIWVVCGYRSPATNTMLRKRSSGVAKFSQHMQGKAIDFYIPGVSLDELRAAGLRAQRGGVGFYPTSGAPFVHMDTGSVRHWPRMPEAQLAKVMSKGGLSSHLASDDRSAKTTTVAQASASKPGFFAKLFGRGKDDEEGADIAAAAAAPAPARAATAKAQDKPAGAATAARAPEKAQDKPAVAAAPPPRSEKTEKVAALPLPTAKPGKPNAVASAAAKPAQSETVAPATSKPVKAETYQVASAASAPVRPAQAASLVGRADITANDIINDRGYWQGLPPAEPVDRAQTTVARSPTGSHRPAATDPVMTATVAPWPLPERGTDRSAATMAYAAQPTAVTTRPAPMGAGNARHAAPDATTVAAKRSDDQPSAAPRNNDPNNVVRVGDRFNDPWMRAMMVTPSAQSFMRTTLFGAPDYRHLGPLLTKPSFALAMTFSEDPTHGLSTEKFSGASVVFTPTVTFIPRTALLR